MTPSHPAPERRWTIAKSSELGIRHVNGPDTADVAVIPEQELWQTLETIAGFTDEEFRHWRQTARAALEEKGKPDG